MVKTLTAAVLLSSVAMMASAETIAVPPGGDLQAALMRARPGDTVELKAGATYVGNFILPNNPGAAFITVRTALSEAPPNDRVTPQMAAQFAKLRSPNSDPTVQTQPGAHHWRLALLEILGTTDGHKDMVELGDGSSAQNALSQVPHDLVIDRSYIHGDATRGQRRCVALNSASTTISNSYIADCKWQGEDAQAIAGWNGPGPFTIVNNYVEASGDDIIFGGGDPYIMNLVPSDIRITGNLISRPPAWRSQSWTVKNLLELKNARRVTIDGNIIEYNWEAGQPGFAILFTVRNQDGGCPWCQVEEVMFERNLVRHSAGGISILGVDNNHPSRQTRSITIRHNVFVDIDNRNWGGSGYCFLISGGPKEIAIEHNTIVQEHASGFLQADGPPVPEFSFRANLVRQNAYGLIGTDHAPGADSIATFFPNATFTGNVIAEGDPARYPRGNYFPSWSALRDQFVAYESGDYRLRPKAPWRNDAEGGEVGAAWTESTTHPPTSPRPTPAPD